MLFSSSAISNHDVSFIQRIKEHAMDNMLVHYGHNRDVQHSAYTVLPRQYKRTTLFLAELCQLGPSVVLGQYYRQHLWPVTSDLYPTVWMRPISYMYVQTIDAMQWHNTLSLFLFVIKQQVRNESNLNVSINAKNVS